MKKHTKGPWFVKHMKTHLAITALSDLGHDQPIAFIDSRCESPDTIADASLLASAPALLRALKFVLDLDGVSVNLPSADRENISFIIAKAEGRV